MPRRIEAAARWAGRALLAAVLGGSVSRVGAGAPAPRFDVPARQAPSARILAPRSEPFRLNGAPYRVTSLLAVPKSMHYGEAIWDDRGVAPGQVWVRIDREAQLISVFRGGHEIGTAVILYGAPAKPTPAGRYPILEKRRQHRSSLYDADMPYSLRLTGDGISIHAADVREGRATHGCIGVPEEFAKRLFEQIRLRDPVFIV
jgi:hypothetical protein